MMIPSAHRFYDFCQLQQFVYETVCQREELVVGAFPIVCRMIRRGARPCGVLFLIHGPRSVIFTSVWESDTNRLFFYGASGERFATIRLSSAPPIHETALDEKHGEFPQAGHDNAARRSATIA